MEFLTKDEILNADDRKTEEVEVPEWGGKVLVRTLSGRERDEFETSMVKVRSGGKQEQNFENLRARLVALCVVDGNGKRMFTTKFEIAALGEKSVAALQRVFNKAQELNGMSDADVEELTENFDETPGEHTSSS